MEATPELDRGSDGSDGAAEPPGRPETASPRPNTNRCAGHTRATAHSRGRRSYETHRITWCVAGLVDRRKRLRRGRSR
jgi:hypothetical protein